MAVIKYDNESFKKALEPGIVDYVYQTCRKKLIEKVNKAIEEVYNELEQTLPQEIKDNRMELLTLKSILSTYDEILKKLNDIGIEVKEACGVSDRYYYFINAISNEKTIFSSEDVNKFIELANIFLKGVEYNSKKR